MITVRISEEQIDEQVVVKCPGCGKKTVQKLSQEKQDDLFDGDAVKVFCQHCSEGFNLEIEY